MLSPEFKKNLHAIFTSVNIIVFLYTSNDDIVAIGKPDGICSPTAL